MAKRKPVVIGGVEYESRAAAAEALGVSYEAVRRAVACGRPDRVGSRHPWAIPVVIDGVEYQSKYQALKYVGVDRSTLERRLHDFDWPHWYLKGAKYI